MQRVVFPIRSLREISGLVGSWHLDEGTGTNAEDTSGNGNNGTLTNNPTWTAGKYGQCLSFVRADSEYVVIGAPVPSALQVSTAFTLEAWINPISNGGANLYQIVGCQYDTGGNDGYTIFVDGRTTPAGKMHFQIGDDSA
ncbi:MAG: hypothetical protein J7M11_06155 [Elusimicrobia bacterium]|nr:hypothetical protein [Elusimicrobiota bacterium]